MGFFVEVVLGGLMAGVLYSLVALGFVLIFKASGVFNFAQGAMVLFAALAMARLSEWLPAWLGFESLVLANVVAFLLAAAIMYVVAVLVERLVLRPLVNQEGITALMATLGVTYFLDGFGQTVWGSDIYRIDLGISKDPLIVLESVFEGGVLLNRDDILAAFMAVVLVAVLAVFFQKTATGRALRSRSAFRSTASGSSCGRWRASPRSWPAWSGAASWGSSSPSRRSR
jgi:branched-chain amino acid transport system permease protein